MTRQSATPLCRGGSLQSKPAWSNTSGCSTTPAFFLLPATAVGHEGMNALTSCVAAAGWPEPAAPGGGAPGADFVGRTSRLLTAPASQLSVRKSTDGGDAVRPALGNLARAVSGGRGHKPRERSERKNISRRDGARLAETGGPSLRARGERRGPHFVAGRAQLGPLPKKTGVEAFSEAVGERRGAATEPPGHESHTDRTRVPGVRG
jgi:hypothetical protein